MNTKSLKTNALLNSIKQVCVIIFPMITFPYASRILGAGNYGKVSFGLSIISYLSLIAALGIANYSIREGARIRNDIDSLQKFVSQIFTLNLLSTLVGYLILICLLFFWDALDSYVLLILVQSVTVLFTTLGVDWINSIFEDYLFITIRYIVCQFVALILMFLFVKTPEDYIIYALVSASSTVLANIWNLFHIKKYNLKLSLSHIKDLRPHMGPVIVMFGSAIASLIYINSDVTILGVLTSDLRVGYYSVSVKIYSLIKQLLNAALAVAIPRFSYELSKGNHDKVNQQLDSLQNILILVAGPAMIGLFSLSREIVILFAGSGYMESVSSLRLLSVALLFATLANFYINVIMIPLKKEKLILKTTILSALINIVLNFVLIPKWNESGAAISTIVAEMIMVIVGAISVRKVYKFNVLKSFVASTISSILVFAIYVFISNNFVSVFWTILFTVFCSVIAFALVVLLFFHDELFKNKRLGTRIS